MHIEAPEKRLAKLHAAFESACENGAFDKRNLVERAAAVCVYGLGKYFADAFTRQSVQQRFQVTHLSDNDPIRRAAAADAHPDLCCISPEELAALPGALAILMLGDPRSAERQLTARGVRCVNYNDLALDEVMNGPRKAAWFAAQWQAIQAAYKLFSDERSQQIFSDIFCNRFAPRHSAHTYEALNTPGQYFPPDVYTLSKTEHFVDCGAYTGDTTAAFLAACRGKFAAVDCFELDGDNFRTLLGYVKTLPPEIAGKIRCHHAGVWSETKCITYGKQASSESFSLFNDRETSSARVVSLDEALSGQNATFLKLDIEGAELSALKGAQALIRRQTPKIAVCVYHRTDDLWRIPLYLKALVPAYRFALRHHADFFVSETVCYAYT